MTEWWKTSEQEVLRALAQKQRQLAAAHRELLELAQEIAARGLGAKHGYVTDVELLRCTQNITKAEAQRRLAAARDVLPTRTVTGEIVPPALPETARAVAEDAISGEHIAVIRTVLAGLKPHLESHRPELEKYLAEKARLFDPYALRQLGARRLAFLDQDGPQPRDTSPTRNRISLAEDGEGWHVDGWLDRESATILRTALSPLCAPVKADDGEPDPRTFSERQADGLIDLARRSLDAGTLPTQGGERPHITITVPLTVLEQRTGNGLLDFAEGSVAGAIAAEDARRWACDAYVVPMTMAGESQPLDIGRASRTVPRWIRRAVAQRDGGGGVPGCTVPHQWCDAHHIIHWADGGPTALHNLVMLCPRHHTLL